MILVINIVANLIAKMSIRKIKGSYWAGQLAHLGIGVFAIGLILNVSQSYSNEYITKEGEAIVFGNESYVVEKAYEVKREEKDIINLPIKSSPGLSFFSRIIFSKSSVL